MGARDEEKFKINSHGFVQFCNLFLKQQSRQDKIVSDYSTLYL